MGKFSVFVIVSTKRKNTVLLPKDAHGLRCFRPLFPGFDLFGGLNQANNCFFEGYMVKGIFLQDTFRGTDECSGFFTSSLSQLQPLKKL
jgi:hypothetical protein